MVAEVGVNKELSSYATLTQYFADFELGIVQLFLLN